MKYFNFIVMIALFVFLVSSATAGTKKSNTVVNDLLMIPYCSSAPEIDGNLDDVWLYTTAIPLLKFEDGNGVHNSYAEHFSTFRIMWDEDYLYIFLSVVDDTICVPPGADPWMTDCFEVFIDGGNEKTTSYDGNDVQWRYVEGENWQSPVKGNGKGEYVWQTTELGYNCELRIPRDSLTFPLEADHVLGFEISNADVDNDVQSRTHVLHWWATDGTTWKNASLFGTAMLSSERIAGDIMRIPYTDTPPTVDGVIEEGEWDVADEYSLTRFEDLPSQNPIPFFNTWDDHRTSARFMWDNDYLYVFVSVVDDTICVPPGADPWMTDCFEIFIDGGNEKTTSYDGNDVQWRYVEGENWQSPVKGNGKGEYVWQTTELGYNCELRIPRDSLTFPLEADHVLGFEISNADVDNDVQSRTHVLHWWATDGTTWKNASLFGTAVLSGAPESVNGKNHEVISGYELAQNYPNPFNAGTQIRYVVPQKGFVKLSVFNILGQEVAVLVNEVKDRGTYTARFNGSALPSGVYLYRLNAGTTTLVRKMVMMK